MPGAAPSRGSIIAPPPRPTAPNAPPVHHHEKLAALLQVLAQLRVELAYTSLAAVVDAAGLAPGGLSRGGGMSLAEAIAVVDDVPEALEAATGGGVVLHLRRTRRSRSGRGDGPASADVTDRDVASYAYAVGFAEEGITVRDDLPGVLAAYLPPPGPRLDDVDGAGPPAGLLFPTLAGALPHVAIRPALAFDAPGRRAASEALLRWARAGWAAPLFGAEVRALAAEGGRLEFHAATAGERDAGTDVALREAVDRDLARFGVRLRARAPAAPGAMASALGGAVRPLAHADA